MEALLDMPTDEAEPAANPAPSAGPAAVPSAAPEPPPVHLYQIAYSPESRAAIEPGYAVLDNLSNPRPDWYEYWPIRQFLLTQPLDDKAYYGFVSPKFGGKTGVGHAMVTGIVRAAARSHQADLVLFSPQPDMGAFFLNVFEQAEAFDAGFIAAVEGAFAHLGMAMPLRQIVMDSRQIIFSNFFIAKPAFWRAWLGLTEPLFALAEDPASPWHEALCKPTSYPGSVQRKVFVIERMASLLLALQPQWRAHSANTFRFGWSSTGLAQFQHEAVICDALKMAFRDFGFSHYIDTFFRIRTQHVVAHTPWRG